METSVRRLSADELHALARKLARAAHPSEQQQLILRIIEGFYGLRAVPRRRGGRDKARTFEHEAAVAAIQLTLRYAAAAQFVPSIDVRVLVAVRRIYSTWEGAVEWLVSPALALGGRVPLDVCRAGSDGVEEVLGVLASLAHGNVQ